MTYFLIMPVLDTGIAELRNFGSMTGSSPVMMKIWNWNM